MKEEEEYNNQDEDSVKTLKRLCRAWEIIEKPSNYLLQKSKDISLKEGAGMSIFRFLRPSKTEQKDSHNCEYYYAEKDSFPWSMMMSAYPRKEDLLRIYDKNTMYIICVSINDHEYGESTIQSIKVFRYLNDTEVEF